jgi:tRNA uridine 5-carboxymethylaminomethyl modification enzyme
MRCGEMARNTDHPHPVPLVIRVGPAVRALRVQCDKKLYRDATQRTLGRQAGLTVGEDGRSLADACRCDHR